MNNDIKKTLWAADKLRSKMDAAEYKHIVQELICLKYISDSFCEHRANFSGCSIRVPIEIRSMLRFGPNIC